MNLSDISKVNKPTLEMGGVWFVRERIVRYYAAEFEKWNRYCKDRNIEIVPEVVEEIRKFMNALNTEPSITDKTCNMRLVFGDKDFDLKQYAVYVVGEYIDY